MSENPWQVALTGLEGEQFCGGSIVSDRVVVTAAHCVRGTPEDGIVVRAGAIDLSTDEGQTRRVTKVIENEKYVDGFGDIAMLVADRPFDESADVRPIALATAADVAAATTGRVTGWGVTSDDAESTPSVLQTADVPLVSDEDGSDDGTDIGQFDVEPIDVSELDLNGDDIVQWSELEVEFGDLGDFDDAEFENDFEFDGDVDTDGDHDCDDIDGEDGFEDTDDIDEDADEVEPSELLEV